MDCLCRVKRNLYDKALYSLSDGYQRKINIFLTLFDTESCKDDGSVVFARLGHVPAAHGEHTATPHKFWRVKAPGPSALYRGSFHHIEPLFCYRICRAVCIKLSISSPAALFSSENSSPTLAHTSLRRTHEATSLNPRLCSDHRDTTRHTLYQSARKFIHADCSYEIHNLFNFSLFDLQEHCQSGQISWSGRMTKFLQWKFWVQMQILNFKICLLNFGSTRYHRATIFTCSRRTPENIRTNTCEWQMRMLITRCCFARSTLV